MKEHENSEQLIKKFSNLLNETVESKIKMEEAIASAEMLCTKFANNSHVLCMAKSLKQACQHSLEDIKQQIDLFSQIIESIKKDG